MISIQHTLRCIGRRWGLGLGLVEAHHIMHGVFYTFLLDTSIPNHFSFLDTKRQRKWLFLLRGFACSG